MKRQITFHPTSFELSAKKTNVGAKTIEKDGFLIEIRQDEFPEDPRDGDNLGTMVCFSSRYNLGDKHNFPLPNSWDDLYGEIEKEIGPNGIILPIYMYSHGGITIRTYPFTCSWDSGQIGFIFCSKEKYESEELSKERAKKVLISEVETYDIYLKGEIYGYVIKEKCSTCGQFNKIDSCYGFYDIEECTKGAILTINVLKQNRR